jgi:hypothetical protein
MKTSKLTANFIVFFPPNYYHSGLHCSFTKWTHKIRNSSNHSQEMVQQTVGIDTLQHRRVVRFEVWTAVMKIEAHLPHALCHSTSSV